VTRGTAPDWGGTYDFASLGDVGGLTAYQVNLNTRSNNWFGMGFAVSKAPMKLRLDASGVVATTYVAQ
jgi:hypothetical protein